MVPMQRSLDVGRGEMVMLIKPVWPSAPGVAVNCFPVDQLPTRSIFNNFENLPWHQELKNVCLGTKNAFQSFKEYRRGGFSQAGAGKFFPEAHPSSRRKAGA